MRSTSKSKGTPVSNNEKEVTFMFTRGAIDRMSLLGHDLIHARPGTPGNHIEIQEKQFT